MGGSFSARRLYNLSPVDVQLYRLPSSKNELALHRDSCYEDDGGACLSTAFLLGTSCCAYPENIMLLIGTLSSNSSKTLKLPSSAYPIVITAGDRSTVCRLPDSVVRNVHSKLN